MGIYNIDRIFNPGAIAVIGASEKADSVGSTLMLNLVQSGFQGELFPVNPRHRTIHGLKTLPSILKAEHRLTLPLSPPPLKRCRLLLKNAYKRV